MDNESELEFHDEDELPEEDALPQHACRYNFEFYFSKKMNKLQVLWNSRAGVRGDVHCVQEVVLQREGIGRRLAHRSPHGQESA